MSRPIEFRAWTGHTMMYQDNQYLGSFIRRVVMQVTMDHDFPEALEHESYLPKGTKIDDYLMEYTGAKDKNQRKIFAGDLLEAKDYWGEGDYAEVAWNEEQLQWYLKRNGHFYEPLRTPFGDGHFAFAIVGNIYENPDMLNN